MLPKVACFWSIRTLLSHNLAVSLLSCCGYVDRLFPGASHRVQTNNKCVKFGYPRRLGFPCCFSIVERQRGSVNGIEVDRVDWHCFEMKNIESVYINNIQENKTGEAKS